MINDRKFLKEIGVGYQYGSMTRKFSAKTPPSMQERINSIIGLCNSRPSPISPIGSDDELDETSIDTMIFDNEMEILRSKNRHDSEIPTKMSEFKCSQDQEEITGIFNYILLGADHHGFAGRCEIKLQDGKFAYRSKYEPKYISFTTVESILEEITSEDYKMSGIDFTAMASDILHEGSEEYLDHLFTRFRRQVNNTTGRLVFDDHSPKRISKVHTTDYLKHRTRKRKQSVPQKKIIEK